MNQPLFIETIKVLDGIFYNLPLHNVRLKKTAMHFYNTSPTLDLTYEMIPENLRKGLVKCRVIYSDKIVSIDFEPYSFKKVNCLTVVESDEIDYVYKSADRSALNRLLELKGSSDEVLIVKNGLITDTSYTNIVLENEFGLFTPKTPLLAGVKRQLLLQKGIIKEKEIRINDIQNYSKMYLINAMIDLEDNICILPKSVLL